MVSSTILSLYADDLLLYISDPDESIPKLLEVLQTFGSFSGYKLNLTKSLLSPVNQLAIDINHAQFPFKVELMSFTYIGVQITRNFKALFKHNFNPLMVRAKQDLTHWSTYLSLWQAV